MLFGAGEGVYMLGAGVLMVLGAEVWLLPALAPGVLGSAVFLVLGRPRTWPTSPGALLAATPVLALLLAVSSPGRRAGRIAGAARLHEWLGALPAIGVRAGRGRAC